MKNRRCFSLSCMLPLFILMTCLTSMNPACLAQVDCNRNFIFQKQAQIDSFHLKFPECSESPMSIYIMGSDITNVDSLIYVKEIKLDLFIQNTTQNVDLKGLRNLKKISRHFFVLRNKLLGNIIGLDNLETCGGKIEINQNEKLSDLNSLNNLIEAGEIEIFENNGLVNMNYFNKLEKCYKINIHHNAGLTSISGFQNLIHPIYFYIENNLQLQNFNALENSKTITSLLFNSNKLLELSGFDALDSIRFYLRIENELFLKSIKGFKYLKSISGYCNFYNIPQLEDISAFDNLRSIGGDLTVSGCDKLTSLSTFQTLRIAGGDIKIAGNTVMTSIKAFNLLDSCYGIITIDNQYKLRTLNAFKNLKFIGTSLIIEGDELEALNAFQSLNEIRGRSVTPQNDYWINLVIRAEKLANINEFGNLKRLRGLSIYNTPSLVDVSGLNNVDTSYFKYLKLWNNPQFSACNSTFICQYLENENHQYYLSGNAPGCNTREEILASCTTGTQEWHATITANGVYPNPCPLNTTLWFEGWEADFDLTVYNSMGSVVYKGAQHNPVSLPVSVGGMYFYKVQAAGKSGSGAVVVRE